MPLQPIDIPCLTGFVVSNTVSEWLICGWLRLSCTKYPEGMTGWKGDPRIFIFTSAMSKAQTGGAERGKKVWFAYELSSSGDTQKKSSINCHANEKQIRFKPVRCYSGVRKVTAQECFCVHNTCDCLTLLVKCNIHAVVVLLTLG